MIRIVITQSPAPACIAARGAVTEIFVIHRGKAVERSGKIHIDAVRDKREEVV